MKSFHKAMGYSAIIFILMIILSISVARSYMKRNEISFSKLFEETGNIAYGGNWEFNIDGIFGGYNRSSDYETLHMNESKTFDLTKELFISTAVDEVKFIEEDRGDIQVDYVRDLPDTNAYSVKYRTNTTSNKLSISASLSIANLSIDKEYKGIITIHVPYDYHFEKVTIDSGAAKIKTENIYTKTNELSIIASFGDIEITINDPIQDVTINCNLGSIDITTLKPIEILDIDGDMGKIQLNAKGDISKLIIDENLGDINIEANAPILDAHVENNMGAIKASFLESVGKAKFSNNMGDTNVTFYDNDDIIVYVDTDLGSATSDFTTTSSNTSDYVFEANMGSIKIHKK